MVGSDRGRLAAVTRGGATGSPWGRCLGDGELRWVKGKAKGGWGWGCS